MYIHKIEEAVSQEFSKFDSNNTPCAAYNQYNNLLNEAFDPIMPEIEVKIRTQRPCPWFDKELKE